MGNPDPELLRMMKENENLRTQLAQRDRELEEAREEIKTHKAEADISDRLLAYVLADLENYGQHFDDCPRADIVATEAILPCTCGLAAALDRTQDTEPEQGGEQDG